MSNKAPERKTIKGQNFDEERALYHTTCAKVECCTFAGPKDGESALKESSDIKVKQCTFSLRYPLWHVVDFTANEVTMEETCRAPIWYAKHGKLKDCEIRGVKAVRECEDIQLVNCTINSTEFGWKCDGLSLKNVTISSEYVFFDSKNVSLSDVTLNGKYSFQYVDGLEIKNCNLNTKDAFWHSRNVTVKNCVVKGEYLAWFSENLTLINCKIIGTQPFCYCKNLKLVNCTMEGCDLAFEYSEVEADVKGRIDSVKNPRSGTIICDEVGEIITGNAVMECTGKVQIR
ncbi:MAG: DUF3737 family protein [Clostridiales bacterium]|nr:DUF3737 family protein [Clostridiales bacterium]